MFYVARGGEPWQLMHIKIEDGLSVLPVWERREEAEAYIASKGWKGVVADEFSMEQFKRCRDSSKRIGYTLLIDLLEGPQQ